MNEVMHATTIVAVRRGDSIAMGGDGQVTLGDTVMKHSARKVRRFDRFEAKLEQYNNLTRAAVELAKDWRSDKMLRRLEALLVVADKQSTLVVSGAGEVIEPDDGVIAIGSGGPYAQAAARALLAHTTLTPRQIVEEAMKIAARICIYTNDQITVDEL